MKTKILIVLFALFFLFSFKVYAYDRTIKDGVYTISSAINNEYVFDVNQGIASNQSNVQLYKSNFSNAQKFKVTYLYDEYYQISTMINNSYVLDISGGIYNDTSNIQLYSSNNSDAQKWIIKDTNDGYFMIFSTDKVHCIDISNGVAQNGSNVQLYTCNN